ncbi:MAG TPA: hypothetical protein VGM02_01570 [Acidobacteriaceae bacterium]|jgi:hypothetical protein
MTPKEVKKADWFEQQALDEVEFRNGYAFYLGGEPFEPNAKPSPAFMAGYRQAEVDMKKDRTSNSE